MSPEVMTAEDEAREAHDRAALAARLIRDQLGAADDGQPYLLNRYQLEQLLDRAWTMGATVVERLTMGERACRICGCTEDRACFGRCWWVEADLCSSCAPTSRQVLACVEC